MTALTIPRRPALWLPGFETWRLLKPLRMDGQWFPRQRLQFEGGDLPANIGAGSDPFELHDSATSQSAGGEVTSHVVSLPASMPVGSLLLVGFGQGGNRTHTWPAGWTELSDDQGSSPNGGLSVAYRIADGAEGSTITVTLSDVNVFAAVAACFTGAHQSSAPELSAVSNQSSTSAPNTNSVTTSWGSDDTIFLSVSGGRGAGSGHSVSSVPSGYSLVGSTFTTSGNDAFSIMAMLGPQAGAAENPGAWSLSSSMDRAMGRTVAIRGA